MRGYDAILLVSFGGPEGPDDVMPFLRNVVRGRGVPDERLIEVEERYQRFGGISPIVAETQALLEALRAELPDTPLYLGNRNWRPLLADTVKRMADDGVERVIAVATSAYSSYSGCRQYLEDIVAAREATGDRAPTIDKLPPFWNHEGFIEANRARLSEAIAESRTDQPTVLFTAHSLPLAMAASCDYEDQLKRTARAIIEGMETPLSWRVVYQSRSGPPAVPWLGPDVLDALRELETSGTLDVVLAPIGFVCDHMEVVYDLDVEAKELALELGLHLRRAKTVGTHPAFVRMLRELLESPRGVNCEPGCCPAGNRKRPSP